jgi:hypothetical protein
VRRTEKAETHLLREMPDHKCDEYGTEELLITFKYNKNALREMSSRLGVPQGW